MLTELKEQAKAPHEAADVPLTEQERQDRKVLEILHNIKYGEVKVIVQDSKYVLIEEKKTTKP